MQLPIPFPVSPRRAAWLLSALLAGGSIGVAAQVGVSPGGIQPGDDLLVVDCLLPGQVRQLGRMRAFQTARRPIRTTARDCEIRGGEYVAYDRANYATALRVWLPMAEAGDAEAQVNVGEIYEKGLGIAPDHALAAQWYYKAAEQGSTRAAVNLGNFYETGLGVGRDPAMALQWYRRASGLPDAVIMDAGTLNETHREMDALRQEVAATRQQADSLRGELERTRSQLDQARRELERRRTEATVDRQRIAESRQDVELRLRTARDQGDQSRAAALARELEERERDLARRDAELAGLRSEIARVESEAERRQRELAELADEARRDRDALQVEVAVSREEATRLRERLDRAHAQLARVTANLGEATRDLERGRARLTETRQALDRERGAASRDEAAIARLEETLADRAREVERQQAEAERLRQELEQAQAESQQYQARVAQIQSAPTRAAQPSAPAASAPPVIEMIDPVVLATRGSVPAVVLRSAVPERPVTGKVTAEAGIMSVTVNDRSVTPNATGMFQSSVAVTGARTPVTVVAVDTQGNRASLAFELVRADTGTVVADGAPQVSPEPPPRPEQAGVRLGNYHALIIGNNEYAKLQSLTTAVDDARAVEHELRTRYGFRTKLLENASRYQILAALAELQERLTENDNLLIYYAGHGELDRVNQRGYWLPVDAEPGRSANWIADVAITDMINIMQARQVLVVADSCYSGALTRSALGQLRAGMSPEARKRWLQVMASKRSRTVLTSGGEQPVLDSDGDSRHSVFAQAFLEVLRGNRDVLEGGRLFTEVSVRVQRTMERLPFDQSPEYAPLRYAGHEGGDFFFVPRSL